jgi:Ca2+-binding RTX toxin-like protein
VYAKDTVYGGDGKDYITGWTAGQVYGEEGNDSINTNGNPTLLSGGASNDYLEAENCCGRSVESSVKGDSGNDTIYAADGYPDVIDCGAGKRDWVEYDRGGVDTATKCEKKRAL